MQHLHWQHRKARATRLDERCSPGHGPTKYFRRFIRVKPSDALYLVISWMTMTADRLLCEEVCRNGRALHHPWPMAAPQPV